MSISDEETSIEDLDRTFESGVLDFLYYDAQRIGSFLAQFDPGGLLQGFKRQDGVSQSSSFKSTLSADGGVPLIAKATGAYETSGSASETGQGEKQFDPFWTNAVSFLEYLEDRSLYYSDLETCPLGHFVKFSGVLTVSDIGLAQRLSMREGISTAMRAGSYAAAQRDAESSGVPFNEFRWTLENKLAFDLIAEMPPAVQAQFFGDINAWALLKPDCMVQSANDILTQHGSELPGSWTVLGILSARAGEGSEPTFLGFEDGAALGDKEGLRAFSSLVAPIARKLAGRPHDAYGITPLLIYRTVKGRKR